MARSTSTAAKPQSDRKKRKAARVRAKDARTKAAALHAIWSPRRWPRMLPFVLGLAVAGYLGHLGTTWPATTKAAGDATQLVAVFLPLDCADPANAAASECTVVAAGATR